jgi:hypothetical protein
MRTEADTLTAGWLDMMVIEGCSQTVGCTGMQTEADTLTAG